MDTDDTPHNMEGVRMRLAFHWLSTAQYTNTCTAPSVRQTTRVQNGMYLPQGTREENRLAEVHMIFPSHRLDPTLRYSHLTPTSTPTLTVPFAPPAVEPIEPENTLLGTESSMGERGLSLESTSKELARVARRLSKRSEVYMSGEVAAADRLLHGSGSAVIRVCGQRYKTRCHLPWPCSPSLSSPQKQMSPSTIAFLVHTRSAIGMGHYYGPILPVRGDVRAIKLATHVPPRRQRVRSGLSRTRDACCSTLRDPGTCSTSSLVKARCCTFVEGMLYSWTELEAL